MLTCQIGEKTVNCFDGTYDRYILKKWSSKGILKCPVCSGQYEYCHGEIMNPYFRHLDKECTGYYSEPETAEHREGKMLLYNWIRDQEGIENCKLESWIPETKQRPDIYFESEGKRYVIEFQCTPIASEYILRRELYKLAGINDIWILGTDKYNLELKNNRVINNKLLKTIEKKSDLFLSVENNKLCIKSSLIRHYLETNTLRLDEIYAFDVNEFTFDNSKNIFVKSNIIASFIKDEKDENMRLETMRKFKEDIESTIESLKEYFSKDYSNTRLYHSSVWGNGSTLAEVSFLSKYTDLVFFIKKNRINVAREYEKSVPFVGRRGGIGWDKQTWHEQIETLVIQESNTDSLYEVLKNKIQEINDEGRKKELKEQAEARKKYSPIFGDFLNAEIVLIYQGAQIVPDNIRFKYLKEFSIFDTYMTSKFLSELKFLHKKKLNKFIFMVPKYHSYFNTMGFHGYVKAREVQGLIIDNFKSFGFTNVKFIEESEENN